ncbi:MAG: SDR family oxidoreductase [Paracoccaceae bacterium]|nr:SDR family oxidoreductase [Paracoccaceae bacterium]
MAKNWALITGASEGLGREFADIAAADGYDLILVARQAGKLQALADTLREKHGVAIEVLPTDLNDPAAAEALWRKAASRRKVDVLVNNAGLGYNGPFTGADIAREMSSVMVNVTALTILMKRAVEHMRNQGGGRILNVGSVAGFMPGANMAVYHATKAYVLSLSEAVAEELRGTDVSVTVLCPGATATNFAKDAKMEDIGLFKFQSIPAARGVAQSGWQAMKAGKRIRVTGLLNNMFAFGPRLGPRALTTRITALFLK